MTLYSDEQKAAISFSFFVSLSLSLSLSLYSTLWKETF